MSACRIARRVASMTFARSAQSDAPNRQTLATKVFDYLFQPFSQGSGGRLAAGPTSLGSKSDGTEPSVAGVRGGLVRGDERRLACRRLRPTTPLTTPSLVAKEKNGEVE